MLEVIVEELVEELEENSVKLELLVLVEEGVEFVSEAELLAAVVELVVCP